eukprot:scpid89908/ scgid12022/ 
MVEEGAGAEISHGFVPTKLAADIKESRCTRPIACVQNYWTDILDEVTKGTGDVASIIDRLKEFGFFELAVGSEHEATQCYLKASHKQDTRIDHMRTLLEQVEEKTRKLIEADRENAYSSKSPLVIFLAVLYRCHFDDLARLLRSAITEPHDCRTKHPAFAAATAAAKQHSKADELVLLSDPEFKSTVLETMRKLRDHPPNLSNAREITVLIEGGDLGTGRCEPAIKKRTKRALYSLLRERSILETGEKNGNLHCYKLALDN